MEDGNSFLCSWRTWTPLIKVTPITDVLKSNVKEWAEPEEASCRWWIIILLLSLPVVNCAMLNYCVLIIHTLKMKMRKLLSSLKMFQTELWGQEESWKLQNNMENQFVVWRSGLIGWNLCFRFSNYRPLFSNLLMTHCKWRQCVWCFSLLPLHGSHWIRVQALVYQWGGGHRGIKHKSILFYFRSTEWHPHIFSNPMRTSTVCDDSHHVGFSH